MAIDLYLMEISPPCRSVLLTAKYLGIDINKKYVDLIKKEHLKPEFLKMNPQHTVPTIDDNGFYLWESRAIMAYLVNQYAPDSDLYPKEPKKRAAVDKMLYFDIGTMYKSFVDSLIGVILKGEEWNLEKEAIIKNAMQSLEGILEKTPYAAGEKLTIVDLSLISHLANLKICGETIIEFDFTIYPHIEAWTKKIEEQLPYYKQITEPALIQLKDYLLMNKQEKKKESH